MPILALIDGRNTLGVHFIPTVRHTCSIHFLATYHQLAITIRPNLLPKHVGYRILESWLEEFLGFYRQASKP